MFNQLFQPATGGVNGFLADPRLQIGLGLLQANNQGADPFAATLKGLARSQQFKDLNAEREAAKKIQEQQETLNQKIQEFYNSSPAGVQQSPVAPQPVNIPGLPASFNGLSGAPPPLASAPTDTAGSGGFDDLTAIFLKYGSPEQKAAAFSQLGAQERFKQQLAAENARFERNPDIRDPVQSVKELEDGSLLRIHRSGKTSVATAEDGTTFKARSPVQFLKDAGGGILAGDKRTGGLNQVQTPETATELSANKKAAETAAAFSAEEQAKAVQQLPAVRLATTEAINIVDSLINHPSRGLATGFSSLVPSLPGTKLKDFKTLLKQAQGKAFLTAYESLKGGGTITEIEGAKAEQALARLETAQTEEGFLQALQDFRQAILDGQSKIEAAAGLPVSAGELKTDNNVQSLIDKYTNQNGR